MPRTIRTIRTTNTPTNFNDKSLLYKLCEFLHDKRINTKGILMAVPISIKEFFGALSEYTSGANNNERWFAIVSELENLMEDEKNEKGERLIRFKDEQMTLEKMKIAGNNEIIKFIYKGEDIERYIDDLKKGDSKKIKKKDRGGKIEKIEILKNNNEQGRIKVYINGAYEYEPIDFSRGKNWGLMYQIANDGEVAYNKAFYDYFNYSKLNPLYKTKGFEVTKILKEEAGFILPNIEIGMTTPNKITRQLNSA